MAMPLIKDSDVINELATVNNFQKPAPEQAAPQEQASTFGQRIKDSFNSDNTIRNIGRELYVKSSLIDIYDPAYNPADDLAGYEDQAERIYSARNATHASFIKNEIDDERESQKRFSDASFMSNLGAGFVAGLSDPTNLIGGGFVKEGVGVLKNVVRAGAVGAAVSTGQEAILQATQDNRALEESAVNVLANGLVSGIFGAIEHGLKDKQKFNNESIVKKTADNIKSDIFEKTDTGVDIKEDVTPADYYLSSREDFDKIMTETAVHQDSVGAARIDPEDIDPAGYVKGLDEAKLENSIQDIDILKKVGYDKVLKATSVSARLMMSDFNGVRTLTEKLVELPYFLNKNTTQATETAFETMREVAHSEVTGLEAKVNVIYKDYRDNMAKQGGTALPRNLNSFKTIVKNRLAEDKIQTGFEQEVAKALRNGDKHEDPHITQAAQQYRKIFDKLSDEAVKMQFFEKTPRKTAVSYFPRVWDKMSLINDKDAFINKALPRIYDRKQRQMAEVTARASETKDKVKQTFEHKETKKAARAQQIEEFYKNTLSDIAESEKTKVDILDKKTQKYIEDNTAKIADMTNERKAKFADKVKGVVDDFDGWASEQENKFRLYDEQLKMLKQGKPKKPETLLSFIVKSGGLKDDAGEVKKFDYKRPGFLNNKSGMNLDDAALKAWEEGFFSSHGERPAINDLLEAVDYEVRGYAYNVRENDMQALDNWLSYDERLELFEGAADETKAGLREKKATIEQELSEARKEINSKIGGLSGKNEQLDKNFTKNVADLQKSVGARYEKISKDIKEQVKESQKKLAADMKDFKAEMEGIGRKRERAMKLVDKRAAREIDYIKSKTNSEDMSLEAEDIYNSILGFDDNSVDFVTQSVRNNSLKRMKLDFLPDKDFENFLVNEPLQVINRYARTVGGATDLMKKFGSVNVDEILKPIERELQERLAVAKDPKDKQKLIDKFNEDTSTLKTLFDIQLGRYQGGLYGGPDNVWKQVGRAAKAYNFMRFMGGFVISNASDFANVLKRGGVTGVYTDLFKPLISSPALVKEVVEDLKTANLVVNNLMASRVMAMADIGSRIGQRSALDKFLDVSQSTFSKLSLIGYFTDFEQAVAGIMSQTRILRNVEALASGAALKPKEIKYMNLLGIDSKTAKKIQDQVTRFGKKDNDVRVANVEQWDNTDVSIAYRSALRKDVDSVIIQPKIGDKPLFANTALGQVLLQFRSFMFAAQTRIFLSQLQNRDAAAAQSITAMIGLGALSYMLKEKSSGREPDMTPQKLVFEGVDRSGLLHIFMEGNNIYEAAGFKGLGKTMAGSGAGRYYDRKLTSAVFGPSLSPIDDFEKYVQTAKPEAQRRAFRKLLPYNNIIWFRTLMSQMSPETQKATGYYEPK